MIKFWIQKSILALILTICPVLMALEGQKGPEVALEQTFTLENVKMLEGRCLQTLNQVLSLIDPSDTKSYRRDLLVKTRVTSLYNSSRALADSHIKNSEIAAAVRLLNGLYSQLQVYTDKSAWNTLLLASSPTLRARVAQS